MHIFSSFPDSASKPKVHDPVFVIMLVAVLLAVGSSLVLRFTVGMGPKSAHASSPDISADHDLTNFKSPPPGPHLKPQ